MIEDNLRLILIDNIDADMTWSVNHSTLKDDSVTVYNSGGDKPSSYEGVFESPQYQVIVKSSNYDKATDIANKIYHLLHKFSNERITVDYDTVQVDYKIYLITALHTPLLLGVNNDDVMEYSLNFKAEILKLSERLK
ncbi:minor capsid protein [Mammaliicoccus sciuri]|uniref:minor capsid protein n=1 Tax=Mammaliicoccus sciuri TaxID=1296 RepID=UPI001D0D05E1|nr:minor capsid protein [Mammaliicoccus sciuri]MCC2087887.1 minor capsid protein [Mammaliicoccus sciuri]